MPVESGGHVIGFAAQLHPRHITHAHDGTAFVAFDDDVSELLWRLQSRLRSDRGGELLIIRRWQAADFTG